MCLFKVEVSNSPYRSWVNVNMVETKYKCLSGSMNITKFLINCYIYIVWVDISILRAPCLICFYFIITGVILQTYSSFEILTIVAGE